MLAHAISSYDDRQLIDDMFEALRDRGRNGLSALPGRNMGSMSHGPARITLVFNGLIPAPHETATQLTIRTGMGYGSPATILYTEEMIISEKQHPLGTERRLDVKVNAMVTLEQELPLSLASQLVGKTVGQAIDQFKPLEGVWGHVITSVNVANGTTDMVLDASSWREAALTGQRAEGSTRDMVGHDANLDHR
jgi:hypothetical protein